MGGWRLGGGGEEAGIGDVLFFFIPQLEPPLVNVLVIFFFLANVTA